MLHPRASKPPSAKNNACIIRTDVITRNEAFDPKTSARKNHLQNDHWSL